MGEVTPAQRSSVEAMGRGIDRLRALTALLLSFLRRGGGPHRPLRLEDVVERALAICDFVIMKKSISVVRLIPEDLPPIRGDAPLLEGVVINLVDNAVRAMSLGGHLRLEARSASGGVELLVADDGKGIDPGIMERLFEPLTTSRPNSDGHGIGLAFAREVLERHGGALTVDTVRGKGTTVFVWLPETPGR
jgi:signal transduction histidine kinase